MAPPCRGRTFQPHGKCHLARKWECTTKPSRIKKLRLRRRDTVFGARGSPRKTCSLPAFSDQHLQCQISPEVLGLGLGHAKHPLPQQARHAQEGTLRFLFPVSTTSDTSGVLPKRIGAKVVPRPRLV
jgi:hypothetical protein